MKTQPLLGIILVFTIISLMLIIPFYLGRRTLAAAPDQPRPRLAERVGCLPLTIGIAVMCTVLLCILPLALISDDQAMRTASQPVIQAVTPDLAGQQVLAEGFISQENP
ncbi:MAG TPA: hypothetical protein VD886_23415, partial [Herpetosiphonaceae bacterium]|nr:hypothetical protein [Herpetosiphonaceae bacterium]